MPDLANPAQWSADLSSLFPLGAIAARSTQPMTGNRSGRAPLVGSITHTAGFCAAVVAERRRAAALGVDSEVIGDVKVELWSSICVPTEIERIRSLPASQQTPAVTLIFSAKEADPGNPQPCHTRSHGNACGWAVPISRGIRDRRHELGAENSAQ